MNWEAAYAARMARVQPSPIMDLIRVMGKRQVINFASGLPDPIGFPTSALRDGAAAVLAEDWRGGLQYGEAEGYRPLREWVAADLSPAGRADYAGPGADRERLAARDRPGGARLLEPGDVVLTENPSYLAALQVFASYEATVRPMPTDADGVDVGTGGGCAPRRPA